MSNKKKNKPVVTPTVAAASTPQDQTDANTNTLEVPGGASEQSTPELTEVLPSEQLAPIDEVPAASEETPPVIEEVTDTSKESEEEEAIVPPVESDTDTEQEESPIPNGSFELLDPWSEPTEYPESGVTVLCEVGSHLPVEYREYIKGQFDHNTGSYFTTKDGPYQIIDVTRWMEVK